MGDRKVPPATSTDQVIAQCYTLAARANEEATTASGEVVRCLQSDQPAKCLPKTAASYTEKRDAASKLNDTCRGFSELKREQKDVVSAAQKLSDKIEIYRRGRAIRW